MKLEGLPLGEIRVHRNSRKKSQWVATQVGSTLGSIRLSDRLQTLREQDRQCAPAVETVVTGRDRSPEMMERRFFFLPPLLYRLMPIFNFVAVFPWIFLL